MSVVKLLDGFGGEVVEVFVRPLGVELVHPSAGGPFDGVEVAPGALPADEFVLERADGVWAIALSSASPMEPTDGSMPSSSSRWVRATEVYCEPASLCDLRPVKSVTPSRARVNSACSSASRTRSVVIDLAAGQPTMRRENASTTKAT